MLKIQILFKYYIILYYYFMNKRLLIFSRKCQSSSNLIVILKNMNLLLNFEMICIEDMISQNREIPQYITKVPALILPEMNKILQGKETFEWIEHLRVNMIKMNITKNMQQIGPHGFTNVEMGGMSDNFAYTITDFAQPKSFLPYGKDEEYAIYTGTEIKKLANKDLARLVNETEQKRKEQEKEMNTLYDNNRKDAILKYEKQKLMEKNT